MLYFLTRPVPRQKRVVSGKSQSGWKQRMAGHPSDGNNVAEDALRDMALFAEFNPAPLLRLDHRGVIIFANRAAWDLLGKKVENASLVSVVPSGAEIDLERCIREGLISSHEVSLGQRDWQFTIRCLPDFHFSLPIRRS